MKFQQLKRRLDLFEMQENILKLWKEGGFFAKSIESRPEDQRYSFYDGPPFITGIPHYATLLPSIAKDIIPRFQTMKGRRVRRVWGWDCHGLPAETQVEKQLGIKNKREIESLGVDKFVAACRDYVSHVSSEWRWYIDHIGRWADMDNAYRTMDRDYMESVIWIFRELYEKDVIYEGVRSSLYCTRCATPLSKFEITMDEGFYREVEDPAVTLKFKIKGGDGYLLAWTTTPWTLPSNRALAVDAKAEYVEAQTKQGQKVVLAKEALGRYRDRLEKTVRTLKGQDLVGLEYEPLFELGPSSESDFKVYAAEFVAMEEGTGIVHVAPAFGEDDFSLGQQVGLTTFVSVDEEGKVVPEVPDWQGVHYKDTDQIIMDDLAKRDLVFHQDTITHSYPFCYRCEAPLIYKAQRAWYLRIDVLRQELIEKNKQINWVPGHFKQGRFEYNLKTAPDWCLSRSRYWGTPLPVWKCSQCDEVTVVGSVAEIEQLAGVAVSELHRPDIDEIKWACQCGGEKQRVPEVFDVWFESGAMPAAERHYPFENEQEFKESFPADFVVEYTGQLRGWFYYLHVIANAMWQSPAFKNVVVTGVMKGNDGRKMSKSYKNYPDPKVIIKKYGGEALRMYFMSSPIMYGEDMSVSEQDIVDHYRKTMLILWNSYRYFLTYAELHKFEPDGGRSNHVLDKWISGQVEQLVKTIDESLSNYDYVSATRAIQPFVEDLSTWYIRRARPRFVAGDRVAMEILYAVLVRLAGAVAPILPFTSEAIYQNLVVGCNDEAAPSIHLTDWKEADQKVIDETEELRRAMRQVRHVAYLGHSLRQEADLSVRQVLEEVQIISDAMTDLTPELVELIEEELNVKKARLVKSLSVSFGWAKRKGDGVAVALNTNITPELKREGVAREIIRHGQALRREANYKLNERITLIWRTDAVKLQATFEEQRKVVTGALQADKVVEQSETEDAGSDITLDGQPAHLGVVKC